MTKRIQPNDLACMQVDYEAGIQLKDIAKRYNVSVPAVSKHIKKGNWQRGILDKKIAEVTERNIIEKFAEIGLTQKKIMQKICDGLDATKVFYTKDGGRVEEDDHVARVRYIQEYNKMVGGYAVEKKEVDLKGIVLNVTKEEVDL